MTAGGAAFVAHLSPSASSRNSTQLWIDAPERDDFYYLAQGPADEYARTLGFSHEPYVLAGKLPPDADPLQAVVLIFDGRPNPKDLLSAFAKLENADARYLAVYDPGGDAVTVMFDTETGVGAQLFGPPPSAARNARFLKPDGRYFVPTPAGARASAAGVTCPDQVAELEHPILFVVDGDPGHTTVACHYLGGDFEMLVSVEGGAIAQSDLNRIFKHEYERQTSEIAPLGDKIVSYAPGKVLDVGGYWPTKDGLFDGEWVGSHKDYLVTLEMSWKPDAQRKAFKALDTFEAAAFSQ